MIFQAPILALLLTASLASLMLVWAAFFALQVLKHWDMTSGSRLQLEMERRTHLVSTMLRFVLGLELVSLLLFVFNADRMAVMFVGAMCAVGTLNINPFGFPTLYLKIAVFFAATIWLILDWVDGTGRDCPMTRFKYAGLLVVAPLVLLSAAIELTYFLNLEADVITSCCSRLFTPRGEGLASEISGLNEVAALVLLAATLAITLAAALWQFLKRQGARTYAFLSALLFVVALLAIVSTVSLYIYEHPNHHCPFCILKPEYNYVGYALYLPLFLATALGIAPAFFQHFGATPSLAQTLPTITKRLILTSASLFSLFGFVVLAIIWHSRLILF